MEIKRLTPKTILPELISLADLLIDAVTHGASVGFLLPLPEEEALAYWRDVAAAIESPSRVLLVAKEGDALAGTVQLDMAARPNGSHRAEVARLMVHTSFRRQGVAKLLMNAVEAEAISAGRTTLVLDTRAGDPSEALYARLGYQRAGVIPEYARSTDGTLHPTAFMYKLLKQTPD